MGFRRVFPVVREQTGDPAQDRMQQERQSIERALNRIPWLDGKLLDGGRGDGSGPGVAIGTSDTLVAHGLGRVPHGFLVLSMEGNAAAVVRSLAANQPTDQSNTFSLIASAATTVKLWVW